MESFNRFLAQLQALWSRWTIAQRGGILGTALLSLAAIAGVGYWAAQPEYVVLADQLSPQQAAEVVSLLEAQNLRYRLNYAGSAVSVPTTVLSKGRLALKDVITPVSEETSSFSEGIWSDPTLHQARMTRQLEQRLARSIGQLASVREATVHLTPGESSPFIRNRSPAKASVILELQPGSMFSSADARSVVSLLSHSVENLDPEGVSVLDTAGRLLSVSQGMEADVTGQLGYRSRVEADLAAKAEAILTQMLGPGRAVVRVTADIDFTKTERKEIRYDPEAKVKVSETIHSESLGSGSKAGGGAVGAASNIDPLAFKTGSSGGSNKVESNTTTYENAKTEDTIQEVPGKIRRLTVAAVVQLPEASEEGAVGSGLQKEQIEKIIRQAVGFDAARADEIEVLAAPLAGNADLLPVPVGTTGLEKYVPLLKNLSLGLASLVALVLGLMIIRRMQPIVVETETRESLPTETVLRLADLAQQARDNPQAVASVLQSWLDQPAAEQRQRKTAEQSQLRKVA